MTDSKTRENIFQKIIRCCENGRDMGMQDVSLEEIQLLCERELPARAAAPVEPPKFWDCLTCGYNNNGSDILCGDCGRAKGLPDANLAATPVEPSPRPQEDCSCGHSGDFHKYSFFARPCSKCSCGNYRAASSPVAQPQTVETYDCDCDDLLCRDNRYCTSAAAARVEQPTPLKKCTCTYPKESVVPCPCCKEKNCPIHYPVAPVVEQRPDFALIAAEKIFALFKNASQRTEGEGHGNDGKK